MKKYFKRTFQIATLTGLVILGACGDDPAPIREEELTSDGGEWKLTALSVKALGQTGDAYADLEDCEKDNIFYFADDGTYQYQVGATKCDVSEPNILESGTWVIEGKNLIITITGEDPEAVEILLLNSTTLKCRITVDFFGVSTTVTSTYTKQL